MGEGKRDIESYVHDLVNLQVRLLHLLTTKFDWVPKSVPSSLQQIPAYGTLEEPSTIWGYSQHGIGIRFVNIRNLACVDIERHLEDSYVFTLWRLQCFMESVGADDRLCAEIGSLGAEALRHLAQPLPDGAFRFRKSTTQGN